MMAFDACNNLTSVNMGKNSKLIRIDYAAFQDCYNLTSIQFPAGVISIGKSAFLECKKLTSIEIPDSVKDIGEYAFSGTGVIEEENGVYYVGKWVIGSSRSCASVTLRSDTVGISPYSFSWDTNLTSITIPASVVHIGEGAFWRSYNLTTVTFGGTKEQWEKVAKNAGLSTDCTVTFGTAS